MKSRVSYTTIRRLQAEEENKHRLCYCATFTFTPSAITDSWLCIKLWFCHCKIYFKKNIIFKFAQLIWGLLLLVLPASKRVEVYHFYNQQHQIFLWFPCVLFRFKTASSSSTCNKNIRVTYNNFVFFRSLPFQVPFNLYQHIRFTYNSLVFFWGLSMLVLVLLVSTTSNLLTTPLCSFEVCHSVESMTFCYFSTENKVLLTFQKLLDILKKQIILYTELAVLTNTKKSLYLTTHHERGWSTHLAST